jgi:transcription initiation factor IIE alpha subunit
VFEIVKEKGALTDDELLSTLNRDGAKCSLDELNKVLMQLEILGLITVRWVSKERRRIEPYTQPAESDTLNQ